jgi:hypothetical protein
MSSESNSIGWELNTKHIFVLSASGKPIFSYYGDEQEMVTTFGLVQAVISIVMSTGDSIKYIKAGGRKIVYFVEQSLYFICISSTNEPEVVLLKHLQFLYSQILLVLTSKVHDVFQNNPGTDLRELLGADTARLMRANAVVSGTSDASDITPIHIAFESLRHFACRSELRHEVFLSLRFCVENSGAALGILLYKDTLVCFSANAEMDFSISTGDAVLLTHFVANSASLRSSDQHWIPICLPEFNDRGFLQAYVSSLQVSVSEKAAESGFSLVLVAASGDPDVFRRLHKNRLYFEKTILEPSIAEGLLISSSMQQTLVDKFLEPSTSIHFMYKRYDSGSSSGRERRILGRRTNIASSQAQTASAPIPAQYLVSSMDALPFAQLCSQDSIWVHYQSLAMRIRSGASTAESSLFPPLTAAESSNAYTAVDSMEDSQDDNDPSVMTASPTKDAKFPNPLCGMPSADHALAYSVLSTGMVVVALATSDSELYVTYAGGITPVDASTMADLLSRTLHAESSQLFQLSA